MYNGGIRGARGGDKFGMVSGRESFVQTVSPVPSILYWKATDASYNNLDDTAVNVGGTVVIYGNGFVAGMSVYLGTNLISSYTLLGSTRIAFTVPSVSFGTYYILLYYGSSSVAAILSPGIAVNAFPTWTTGSYITQTAAISVQLLATGDGPLTYYLQAGSSLPNGVTLSSVGLLSGTLSNPVSGTVYSFTVLVDDAQLQTTQQNVTLTVQFLDPYFNTTSLLLNGETTNTPFNTDASTNNYALTSSGVVNPTLTNPFKDGYYSTFLTGSEYFYTTTLSTRLNFGTSTNFTIECWIFINGSSTSGGLIHGINGGIDLWINGSNYLSFGIAAGSQLVTDTVALLPSQWYHVAVARSGTTLNLFKNGVIVATATNSTAFTTSTNNYFGYRQASTAYFIGFISNLRIVNGTAVYTSAFTPPTSPLTAIANTVLLTFQSNKLIDRSPSNFDFTTAGTWRISEGVPFTKPTSVIVNTGNSVYFDGSSAYLTTPSSTSFLFDADFTIEAWVYFTNIAGTSPQTWFSMGTGATTFDVRWFTSKWQISLNSGGGTDIGTTPAPVNYTWTHVAAVRSGSSINFYVNGVATATTLTNSSTLGSSSLVVNIGAGVGNGNKLTGYVSNLRVVKGLAVYTGVFTPPTSALSPTQSSGTNISAITTQTVLLTCQGSPIVDASTNAFTITQTGSPKVLNNNYPFTQPTTTVSNLNTIGSAYFNGTSDYLQLPTTATGLTTASGNFTCEFWTYTLTASATVCYYASLGTNSDSYGFLTIYKNASGNLQFVSASNATTNDISIGSSVAMPLNQWVHVAVVRYGNIYRLYQNGVSVATVTNATARYIAGTLHSIGAWVYSSISYYLNGYISNFRFVNGTALYTTNFAIPYQPLTAIANTQLLTLQNIGGVHNYTAVNEGSFNVQPFLTGNPTVGTFNPYSPTGWSNLFNGSTDYYSVTTGTVTIGSGTDHTIEAWVYVTGTTGSDQMIAAAQTNGIGFMLTNALNIKWNKSNVGGGYTSTGTISLNTWTHVAVSRDSGTARFWINGVLSGSNADTTAFSSTFTQLAGAGAAFYFKGYISNFRQIVGTALYISAFTPSTSPLIPITNTVTLACQSNRFIDNSTANGAITSLTGTPSVQAFSPFNSVSEATPISYSTFFNGSSDYLSVPSSTSFVFGTGDFTVEMWVYTTSAATNGGATTDRFLFGGIGNTPSWTFYIQNSTTLIPNFYSPTGSMGSSITVTANVWTHLALVRYSGNMAIYVNGALGGTGANSTNYTASGTQYIAHDTNDGANKFFPGYISNLRVVKGTAVYTSAFTPSTTPLTAITNTVLLTCQSPTIVDNSTNYFTITAVSTPKVYKHNPYGYTSQVSTPYTPSIHGGSIYFNGTTLSYYKAGSGDPYPSIVNSDFTVDFWVYPTGTNASNINLFTMGTDGSSGTLSLYLNNGMIQNYVGGGATAQTGSTGVTVTPNAWNHYAIVRTISNNYIYVYLNGVLTGYMTFGGGYPNSALGGISLGGPTYSGGQYTSGYISNFRVFNKTLYTSNFVPPTQLQTTSTVSGVIYNPLYLFNSTNGGIVDAHSSNNLETVGGAQLSTLVKKFSTGSMSFSGTSQYLYSPFSNIWDLKNTYTIEGWIYPTVAAYKQIFTITVANTGSFAELAVVMNTTTLRFEIRPTTSGSVTGVEGGTISLNQWTHFAVSVSNLSAKLFLNGTQVGTTTTIPDYTATMLHVGIGANGNGYGASTDAWAGYIDDLRITKGFARYTGNFTTPTQTFLIQ